jgi:hypothetical protein
MEKFCHFTTLKIVLLQFIALLTCAVAPILNKPQPLIKFREDIPTVTVRDI